MIQTTKYIPDGKKKIKQLPIMHYLDAKYLYYPLTSTRCPKGETCIIEGQNVKVGEVIGTRNAAFFEQPIQSTVSGKMVGIEKHLDESGKYVDCLIIQNDMKYTMHESIKDRTESEISELKQDDYVKIAKNAGLVGLGGSAFPTYIKLQTKDKIDYVIANGVECEPRLVNDYFVMMNNPEEIIQGLIFAMNTVGANKGIIGIKKKYKEVAERFLFALREFPDHNIKVIKVSNYYPQGWELDLIKTTTGIKIPQGELLSEYGVLNFNVSTLQSIYNAVKKRLPILERFYTISGEGIHNSNFKARIGTLVPDLIKLAGGYKDVHIPKTLTLGGPMMGKNIPSDDIIMTHISISLIVSNYELLKEEPCIHCASCVYSCPVSISPVQIMNMYKVKNKQAIKDLAIDSCIECGLCSYVCPSKIHLTEYMRLSKRLVK